MALSQNFSFANCKLPGSARKYCKASALHAGFVFIKKIEKKMMSNILILYAGISCRIRDEIRERFQQFYHERVAL